MEMGGREEIILERETASLIIPKILPEVITTSSINPSLKRTTIYRRWFIFICTKRSTSYIGLRGDERSKEN
jgi:hypothetical protein